MIVNYFAQLLFDPNALRKYSIAYVDSLKPFFDLVIDLEDTEISLQLLCNYFSVYKIGYLFLTIPLSCSAENTTKCDEIIKSYVRTKAGGVIISEIFRELQLTAKPTIGNHC